MIYNDFGFEELMAVRGILVTIIHRTPRRGTDGKILKDSKGKKLFDEEEIELIARIKTSSSDKSLWNQTMLEKLDAKGLFYLKDGQYLNADSDLKVIYEDEYGGEPVPIYYKMQKPIKQLTHWSVGLKSREV